jgi:hypothetical protein
MQLSRPPRKRDTLGCLILLASKLRLLSIVTRPIPLPPYGTCLFPYVTTVPNGADEGSGTQGVTDNDATDNT